MRESEEKFQAVLDIVPDGLLLAERESGRLLQANLALCRMLGRDADEVGNLAFADIVSGEDLPRLLDELPQADGDLRTSANIRLRRKDGTICHVDISASYFRFCERNCLVAFLRDTGAIRLAEDAARRQLELTTQILDNIPNVIFWKDRDSNYLGCNASAARISGIDSPADIVGKNDFDMPWTREQAEFYRKVDKDVMDSGKAQINFEESQRRADGSLAYILTSKVPLRDAQGEVIGILEVFSDITERKQMEKALRESEERYRGLFAKSKVPMLLIDPRNGAIIEANDAACGYYGYGEAQFKSMRITDINIFSSEQVQEEMQHARAEKRSHFYFRHRLASGEIRDVEVHSGPFSIGERHLLYSVIHDITKRREAERLLRESESRFRHVMEHAPLGIGIVDLNGRFTQVNQALCDIVGLRQEELAGRLISDITHPDDRVISARQMQGLVGGESNVAKYEKRYLHRDGHQVWVQISITLERDWNGAPLYFIQLAEDISRRKEAEQRVVFLAHHDRLTELPNRELFADRLSRSISHARRTRQHLVLFFLDLDGFKAVNDRFGHEAGDTVLQAVAKRLLACVREADTVARLGGDEFAIIFDEIADPVSVAEVAKKIIHSLSEPVRLKSKQQCGIGVSIGISSYPENGTEIDRLMSAADDAMYASKRRGRNNYSYFQGQPQGYSGNHLWIAMDEAHLTGDPELDRQHQELVDMLNQLNDAVRNNEPQQAVGRMFDDMIAYAASHFAVEERMMEECGYPDAASHKDEHKRLMLEAHYLKEQLAQGGELLVLQSIKDWLLAHTANVDKPFAVYFNSHCKQPVA